MALLKVTQKYGLPHSIGICARIQNYFLMAIVHYASFWVRSEENWGVSPPPWKGPTLHWQRTSFAQIVQSHSTHSRHQLPELIFCQLRISKVRLVIVNHQLSWSSHTHSPHPFRRLFILFKQWKEEKVILGNTCGTNVAQNDLFGTSGKMIGKNDHIVTK